MVRYHSGAFWQAASYRARARQHVHRVNQSLHAGSPGDSRPRLARAARLRRVQRQLYRGADSRAVRRRGDPLQRCVDLLVRLGLALCFAERFATELATGSRTILTQGASSSRNPFCPPDCNQTKNSLHPQPDLRYNLLVVAAACTMRVWPRTSLGPASPAWAGKPSGRLDPGDGPGTEKPFNPRAAAAKCGLEFEDVASDPSRGHCARYPAS